jgi:hypothetical protein
MRASDTGDTIYLQDATANAFQVGPYSGVYAVADNSYTVNIIGGTGRFAGATGQLSTIGVLDTNQGKSCPSLSGDDLLRTTGAVKVSGPRHAGHVEIASIALNLKNLIFHRNLQRFRAFFASATLGNGGF